MRHELTNSQWEVIKTLMPDRKRVGRPANDFRTTLKGMLWILRTGAPWRDLPEAFGAWQSVYHWFNTWSRDGLIKKIFQSLQVKLADRGRIDKGLWCVDGTIVRARDPF